MDDFRKDLLEIVTQTRMHLELQRALGVSFVSTTAAEGAVPEVHETRPVPAPAPLRKPETGPSSGMAGGRLEALREELNSCTACTLGRSRKHIVFGEGNPGALLLFVGEGPGQEEDDQGRPFAGAAGQLLTDIIVKGMKLRREDVYLCNIVKCRPPENRKPEQNEIEACAPVLQKQIEAIQPKIIVALGNAAAQALLKTKDGITTLRGKWQKFQGIPVMPTFHPAHLLRKESDKKLVWEDIKKVLAEMDKGKM
jgi:uracil-DNA glycosylase family 4